MGAANVLEQGEERLLAARVGPMGFGAVGGDEDGAELAEGGSDEQAEVIAAVVGRQLALPAVVSADLAGVG